MAGECIVCGSGEVESQPGLVAPFLAQRIWKKQAFRSYLLHCKGCDFLHFTPRLSDAEEAALYLDYRGHAYQVERHESEPWYTEKLNASLYSAGTMQSRRSIVGEILRNNLKVESIGSVLDFGGGRGELVDGLIPNTENFVYDIAKVGTLPGVTALELGDPRKVDLVLCSNVFEHVAFPRQLLRQIVSFMKPGSYVFIEVPNESPLAAKVKVKRIAQFGILLALRTRLALQLARFGTLNVMHEHLNFYQFSSLRRLIDSEHLSFDAEGGYGETIWILAQLSPTR
jgi:SAM-dependent methyltransferase